MINEEFLTGHLRVFLFTINKYLKKMSRCKKRDILIAFYFNFSIFTAQALYSAVCVIGS
jgi:hypothetical protein